MTPPRLAAIGFIFVCTSIAWAILGSTVVSRTGEADYTMRQEVEQLWGGVHSQRAPRAYWIKEETKLREVEDLDSHGNRVRVSKPVTTTEEVEIPVIKSDLDVDLGLDHRKKGLLWYSTYKVAFAGDYTLRNPDRVPHDVQVRFDFPSAQAIYDGFVFEVNGRPAPPVTDLGKGSVQTVTLQPGETATVHVAYKSRGLERWDYRLGDGISQVQSFSLALRTDFADVDFPAGTLSPSSLTRDEGSAQMAWTFDSLVTGHRIGLVLPQKLNPGPLVVRISFFAPISLLFFFTVLIILGVMKNKSLHPMNYFFLSAAFFAFHLLLAYLVDHVNVHLAFGISAVTAVALVVSYLRLVAGARFAFLEAGTAQLVFLVLFSYAFFFEGQTGLSVVIGAVLTLFVLMQLTARVDWSEVFGGAGDGPSGAPVGLPTFKTAPAAAPTTTDVDADAATGDAS
jgi:hypothetical protein